MKRKIEKMTIIRTAVLMFALANQFLSIIGYNPLPFTDDQFGQAVSMVFTVAASLWNWWKNNSFTQEAIIADENMRSQKKGL